MSVTLQVVRGGNVLVSAQDSTSAHLVFAPEYRKGDIIGIQTDTPGIFRIRLEDTMPETLVYIPGTTASYPIPFGVERAGYSPRSFTGKKHLITITQVQAAIAGTEDAGQKGQPAPDPEDSLPECNLALNPYDAAGVKGIYPHATTNVTYADSLRNKIFPDRGLFAARNAIDGYTWNESHRLYPYQSFGVNRMADAYLDVDFGRAVDLTAAIFYLRCEFPHDTCWTSADLICTHPDGSSAAHTLTFQKSAEPQRFELHEENVTTVRMEHMQMPADDPGFAALTELQLYGTEHSL